MWEDNGALSIKLVHAAILLTICHGSNDFLTLFSQVARLFSKLMVEIGYRTKPDIYEDTASDILKQKDPQGYFEANVDNAIGGVVFVDVSLLCINILKN